ncbi:hypothetical protein JTB14_016268 [Gonioctena quinquepunctata]|nr:hypothetical protein JTB14_016268 [Gonioctena quinquepunctata]
MSTLPMNEHQICENVIEELKAANIQKDDSGTQTNLNPTLGEKIVDKQDLVFVTTQTHEEDLQAGNTQTTMTNNVGIQVNALELNMFFNTFANFDRNDSDNDESGDLIIKNKKPISRRQRKNNKIMKKKSNINKDGNVCNDVGLNNEYRNKCSIQEELSQSLKDTPSKRGAGV